MKVELFIGLSDRAGNPIHWKETKMKFYRELCKIGYATIFDCEGIYTNEQKETFVEASKLIMFIVEKEEKETLLEKIKTFSDWFLKETNQESVMILIDSKESIFYSGR